MSMIGQFDSDVAAVEPELPVSFVWMGKTITGSKNSTADRQSLADAGIIQMYDLDLLVRVSVFTAANIPLPAKNDAIRIQDAKTKAFTNYRIDKQTMSQDGVCLLLGCVQLNDRSVDS